jgi:hypothetical protein
MSDMSYIVHGNEATVRDMNYIARSTDVLVDTSWYDRAAVGERLFIHHGGGIYFLLEPDASFVRIISTSVLLENLGMMIQIVLKNGMDGIP